MKFTLPQEISQHVRNKLCKFFNTENTTGSSAKQTTTTCTITSNEGVVELKNVAQVSASQTFPLITTESIKYPLIKDDKVLTTPITTTTDTTVTHEDLNILDSNLTDILLNSTTTCNAKEENANKDFETVIGEIDNNEKQVVEILFSCKICQFR